MSNEIIQKPNLISQAKSIIEKIEIPDRHTYFQIEKFIIGKEPTAQSQLWAIIKEIQARIEAVESLEKDLLNAEDDLELFDIRIERLNRELRGEVHQYKANLGFEDLDKQEIEINIRKLIREKEHLQQSAQKLNNKLKGILEEINYLLNGYNEIIKKYGEVKPLDDAESQREYWSEKILEEFNLRIILQRPFDPEFIKTAMALNDDSPAKQQVVKYLDQIQKQMIENIKVRQIQKIEGQNGR